MARFFSDSLFSKQQTFNKRKQTSLHYHDDIELYFLLNGRVKYFLNNKSFQLKKGNLIIIPPHVLHSNDSEGCLYNERMLLNFNKSHYSTEVIPYIKSLYFDNIICIPNENIPVIEDMFNKINYEYVKKNECSEILIKLYINELIIYLYRYKTKPPVFCQNEGNIMQQVADYITLNYNKDLSLSILCKHFSLSESYMSRIFKRSIGTRISEYISYVRITKAASLLKETDMPVTEVSAMCGFNDSNYFSTVFKKLKGTTPYKYKSKNKK